MRPTTSALPNSAETPHPTPTPTATARSQRTRTESQRQRSTQERLRRGGRRIDAAHPQPRRRPQRSPVPVAAPPSTVQGAITSVAVNTRFGPPPPTGRPGNIEVPGLLRSPERRRRLAFYRDLYRVEAGGCVRAPPAMRCQAASRRSCAKVSAASCCMPGMTCW